MHKNTETNTETIIPDIYKENLDEIILDYLEAELEGYLDDLIRYRT